MYTSTLAAPCCGKEPTDRWNVSRADPFSDRWGKDFRSGSHWDLDVPEREVRFAPLNGHRQRGGARPLSANKRLMRCSK